MPNGLLVVSFVVGLNSKRSSRFKLPGGAFAGIRRMQKPDTADDKCGQQDFYY
jgi:hypothetical protein